LGLALVVEWAKEKEEDSGLGRAMVWVRAKVCSLAEATEVAWAMEWARG